MGLILRLLLTFVAKQSCCLLILQSREHKEYLAAFVVSADQGTKRVSCCLLFLQTRLHKEYLDHQFALLGPEAVAYANMSEFFWAFASVASRASALPATSKLPTYYTQKVVPATAETLAAAEKAFREKASGGADAKKGLSWEDEFLFDDAELEKLKAAAEAAEGKAEGQEQLEEEGKVVSVLLPLVDLFDFDEHANIRLEVLSWSLVLACCSS